MYVFLSFRRYIDKERQKVIHYAGRVAINIEKIKFNQKFNWKNTTWDIVLETPVYRLSQFLKVNFYSGSESNAIRTLKNPKTYFPIKWGCNTL